MIECPEPESRSDRLALKYEANPLFRGLVQAIPYVGGLIDSIVSDIGSEWRTQRIEFFFSQISCALEKIESANADIHNELEKRIRREDFHDLFIRCMKESAATRHKDKITRFSRIISDLLMSDEKMTLERVNQAELHLEILTQLSENDFKLFASMEGSDLNVYTHHGKYYDLENYAKYIIASHITVHVNYGYDNQFKIQSESLFMLRKLTGLYLIDEVEDSRTNAHINVNWTNKISDMQSQSVNQDIHYEKKVTYSMNEFGRGFYRHVST